MNLDDLHALFAEHHTPESYRDLLVELRSLMRLVERFASVGGTQFVTARYASGLSITWEDGRVTATMPGLAEAIPEALADAPGATLEQIDRELATLREMGLDVPEPG